MRLTWVQWKSPEATHFVNDGQESYYTSAPGKSLRFVAESFAETYDHGDTEGDVNATVCYYKHDTGSYSKEHYFSFDEQGNFQWR